jgi:hypothetical protein
MKTLSAAALLAWAALEPAAVNAHDVWIAPADVVTPADVLVDRPVWVNPGVYVSQYSGVRRDYPYVGCCVPPFENWSYMRPYPSSFGIRTSTVGPAHYSPRHITAEPPRAADRLNYPDGKAIERFR